jgi:hypothetical protein
LICIESFWFDHFKQLGVGNGCLWHDLIFFML